jgi:hypothetical protein
LLCGSEAINGGFMDFEGLCDFPHRFALVDKFGSQL